MQKEHSLSVYVCLQLICLQQRVLDILMVMHESLLTALAIVQIILPRPMQKTSKLRSLCRGIIRVVKGT